jgi:hypothetical protein
MTSRIIARIRARQKAAEIRNATLPIKPPITQWERHPPVMTGCHFTRDVIINGQLITAGTKVEFAK